MSCAANRKADEDELWEKWELKREREGSANCRSCISSKSFSRYTGTCPTQYCTLCGCILFAVMCLGGASYAESVMADLKIGVLKRSFCCFFNYSCKADEGRLWESCQETFKVKGLRPVLAVHQYFAFPGLCSTQRH